MTLRTLAGAAALVAALGAGACGDSSEPEERRPARLTSDAAMAALEAKAALRPCPQSTASSGSKLDLVLPCLAGGEPRVRLTTLGRPAVVNLWASWCRPCADELPIFAAVDKQVGDRVLFLGVDTADSEYAGLGTLIDAGVHYPSVFDPHREVQKQLGLSGVPATVFMRADGSIAHTKFGAVADAAELRQLLRTYLGVLA